MNKIDSLPIEIQNYIYKFINPINKFIFLDKKPDQVDWCVNCYEYIPNNMIRIKIISNKENYSCMDCFNKRNI